MEQTVEEYIKENLEKLYLKYIEINSCPNCNVMLGMLEDKNTTFCLICGYKSIFKKPE